MPCSRAQATIRVSSSLDRAPRPVGFDGRVEPQQLQIAVGSELGAGRRTRRVRAGQAGARPRTSGRPGAGRRPGPRGRGRAGSGSQATSSLEPTTGRTLRWVNPARAEPPLAPARQRVPQLGACPTPWDSRASPPPRPAPAGSARAPGRPACRRRGRRSRPDERRPSPCTAPACPRGRREGGRRLRTRLAHFFRTCSRRHAYGQTPRSRTAGAAVRDRGRRE